jgi:hypothetical protein
MIQPSQKANEKKKKIELALGGGSDTPDRPVWGGLNHPKPISHPHFSTWGWLATPILLYGVASNHPFFQKNNNN